MKKQKLFNKGDFILFIGSTSIKVSPNANKIQNTQEHSIGRSKEGSQRSYIYVVQLPFSVAFRLSSDNYHDAPESRKLIKSTCPKNNNYLLMDGAYAILDSVGSTINNFINNKILLDDVSFS